MMINMNLFVNHHRQLTIKTITEIKPISSPEMLSSATSLSIPSSSSDEEEQQQVAAISLDEQKTIVDEITA